MISFLNTSNGQFTQFSSSKYLAWCRYQNYKIPIFDIAYSLFLTHFLKTWYTSLIESVRISPQYVSRAIKLSL